jgi:hypothetical protein
MERNAECDMITNDTTTGEQANDTTTGEQANDTTTGEQANDTTTGEQATNMDIVIAMYRTGTYIHSDIVALFDVGLLSWKVIDSGEDNLT